MGVKVTQDEGIILGVEKGVQVRVEVRGAGGRRRDVYVVDREVVG